jgi:hypothetical protein
MNYEREKTGLDALISAKEMKLNDLLVQGLKTKDKSILDQVKQGTEELNKYKNWKDNLINKFPDVGVTQTARFIGDEIYEHNPINSTINPFHWISKNDVEESVKRIEQKHPGFTAKYGKFVDVIEHDQGYFKGYVPKGGVAGGLDASVNNLEFSAAGAVAGLVGDKKTREFAETQKENVLAKGISKSGETPSRVVYDNDGKVFIEKPNEDYGKLNWNSAMRFAGTSIPGLAAWIIPETAGVKAAEALGAGKELSQAIGLMSASYATSYDDNYKIADNLIDDNSTAGEAKKHITANLLTLTTAGVFHMLGYSPTKFVENAFTKSISDDAAKLLEENDWKGLPKNKLQAFIKDVAIPKAQVKMLFLHWREAQK